ncbi:reverse transcriptase [Purpureocillium lavendulum]|uniref:Reverse transcriptase n=1 Tax=Purpureocillium lavendulum TaxID=1247861 RepID=A0AB34FIL7_9HYPO|nr:reverse transcriptase [Purpureocillium lavendulum]
MASASSSPPHDDDPFDLGPRTPSGLARGARVALLRNSPATREGEIGVSRSALRTAYTPSSPLHAVSYAAATEGAQRAVHFDSSEPDPQPGDGPVTIANAADKLVVAQNEVYSAKLAVFRAFCSSFDDTAKQFTSGPALQFAQKFSSSFLQYWTDVLAGTHTNLPTTKPSYATVVGTRHPAPAVAGTTADPVTAAPQNQWQQQLSPRRQGQRHPLPRPTDDFRVFARLRPGHAADISRSFAVRTHIADKLGIDRSRIPEAHPCKTGWAIRAADLATRDLLTERQAEWASDISAEIVETRQEWYKYAVQGCPRRLNNIFGEAIDDEKAIRDEVVTQTGQTPVMVITAKEGSDQSPTRTLIISFAKEVKHYWRLFDTTSYARRITKTRPPKQRQHRDKRPFRVFQANVGKNGPSHDCALALADAERYEVILLQEPWTQVRDSRCLTKTHPAYDTYSPVSTWEDIDTRPRVMTYIRRGARLLADQQRPALSRDILWLVVNGVTLVNVYREPDVDSALEVLFAWLIPSQCIIAGDFNARHHTWQVGPSRGHGGHIAEWAAENDLALLNPINTPTNAHGNTIDLAFSNILLAEATVEDHLATSSDHFTLSISLPALKPATLPPGKILLASDEELKRFKELVLSGTTIIPQATTTAADLDQLADAIIDLIQSAARAAGRQSQCRPRKAPWWNEECAASVAELRCVRRAFPLGFNRDVQLARRDLRRVVRRAKRAYWRDLIDSVQSDKDVFKITRWLKRPGVFRPPPLQVGEAIIETQIGKAEALRHATLERRTVDDDISDPWAPAEDTIPIPFSPKVPIEEVQDALLRTGNTSPGSDNITVRLLRTAWPALRCHIQRLYQGCLSLGYHPLRFKEAEVVMIEKPGKRDLSKTRAWRPISLLSCLGKGLERLIARRLAWASIRYGILHPQQIGALPKRSAVDLVTALVHDIETALAHGQVATLITMDVQGAFDTVMRNRLILRLRQQGWPPHLVGWTGSFMQDRSAAIRFQDVKTPASPLRCGLAQGSPVSPILFALYIAPIYRLGNSDGRFGYADDTAMLRTGRTLEETTALASQDMEELLAWGAANGVTFDPDKTEVMHFSRKKIPSRPSVFQGGTEIIPGDAMRWLGLWLDRKLSFKFHVDEWSAKARRVANLLKGIANTKHGPLPRAVRRAVKACVEPTLFYGAEAWYPRQVAPSVANPNRLVSTQVKHLVLRLDKVLRHALRAALPVWKTTPIPAMHREAGTPPATIALAAQQIRFSARLKSLDGRHPLVKRASRKPPRAWYTRNPSSTRRVKPTFQSRLQRTDQLLPKCHRPTLLPRHYSDTETSPLQTANKAKTAGDFLEWLGTAAAATLIVYSDGSQLPNGAVGFGFAIHRNKQSLVQGSGRLGPSEVFDAEAIGALEGLRAALRLGDTTSEVVVCTDNLAVASCLRGNPADSSQDKFTKFQELATSHGNVQVRWIPGHTNIPGNEEADGLAKAGCLQPEPPEAMPSLAHLRRLARQQSRDAFKAWWSTEAPESYKTLDLEATTSCPPELALPRATLHSLLAARSRHGDFADYHERFNHDDARLDCSCGRRKTPEHPFYCRKVPPRLRMRLAPSPAEAIHHAVGKGFKAFVEMTSESSFFQRICPRH